jgi:hypothetical protein
MDDMEIINTGQGDDKGIGDTFRVAFEKVNRNFALFNLNGIKPIEFKSIEDLTKCAIDINKNFSIIKKDPYYLLDKKICLFISETSQSPTIIVMHPVSFYDIFDKYYTNNKDNFYKGIRIYRSEDLKIGEVIAM